MIRRDLNKTGEPAPSSFYFLLVLVFALFGCQAEHQNSSGLNVYDDALEIRLIDSQPNIQTPIGLTIDDRDHLYFLESHTHTPPSDYAGPSFDRIKRSQQLTKNLEPKGWIIYADSIEDGMNLTWYKGKVFLVTKDQVEVFQDLNGDGIADKRDVLLNMNPPDDVYDHAGLLGICVSPDEWLYVSRGNTGGKRWKITGSDGSNISGFGDGGNIMRCRLDGSNLEEVCTGFWNPFDLKFTAEGRLLATDNDPDSRGPNRLLEIVEGGHYGYESLYGGSGLHPFLAWNGELPGTLPYAAPLGEAPTALIDASFTNFPDEYQGQILVQIWEENNIVRIPMEEKGASIGGRPEVLIQGGEDFHPVAFATNSKGDLFMTDWVVRQYPNHGKGKLWMIKGKSVRLDARIQGKSNLAHLSITKIELRSSLESKDPFVRLMGRRKLLEERRLLDLFDFFTDPDPALRIQALLIANQMDKPMPAPLLKDLLSDSDIEVQRAAMIHLAKKGRVDLAEDLHNTLLNGQIPDVLFETFLATKRHLQPGFQTGLRDASSRYDEQLQLEVPKGTIRDLITNDRLDPKLRAAAMPHWNDFEDDEAHLMIDMLLTEQDPILMTSLLQAAVTLNDKDLTKAILHVVNDQNQVSSVRMQALVALDHNKERYDDMVMVLLDEKDPLLLQTAIWYLGSSLDSSILSRVKKWISPLPPEEHRTIKPIWDLLQGESDGQIPQNDSLWHDELTSRKPSVEMGRIIFQLKRTQCQSCHQIGGWGGSYGPDLTHIGSSKSKTQLIDAVLKPSLEIAPEWQGWFLIDSSGTSHMGRQIDVGLNSAKLMHQDGSFYTHPSPQDYGVLEASLMPEGLEHTMTVQAFADLIGYLELCR